MAKLEMAADYDHVVIDGAPRNYEVARSAIAAAGRGADPGPAVRG
jgi:hypothetical protein